MRAFPLKRLSLIVLSACLLLLVVRVLVKHQKADKVIPSQREPQYPIQRQVYYGFTLQNGTNRVLEKASLWTYAPVKETSTQRCLSLEASSPYQLIVDDLGNQILLFEFKDLPPYSTKIISIEADLALSNTPNPVGETDMNVFLQAERYIEVEDTGLLQVAKRFANHGSAKRAENIFQWVADNVQHAGYVPNDRGALYALREKTGDCTEYMYLFTALCRANGIPARALGGYVCDHDCRLKPNAYHNWAEFYENGAWRIADPDRKAFAEGPAKYIAMEIMSESVNNPMGRFHRFRFAGDGLRVKMTE